MMKAPLCLLVAGLVSAVSFLTGCVQTTERGLTANPPAYTDPTKLELLTTVPDRPHVVVGEIQIEDGDWRNEQVAETKIRTEGARLLADAVIVYGRSGPQRPRAIRYTDTTRAVGTTFVSAGGAAGAASGATGGTGGASGGSRGGGGGGAFPDTGR
jgi:hypothetical protein